MNKTENVIIIGSGPAAHTAAIYAARAKLEPLVFEGFLAGGVAAGGQLTTTTEVGKYPGFPDGSNGPALLERMRAQSIHCGARIVTETVTKVDFNAKPFKIISSSKIVSARAVIVATGAT